MLTFAIKKKRTPFIAPKHHVPTVSPISHSLHLQQAKVRHILRGPTLQAKLTIGAPNDKYEQEADRVAEQVMRMSEPQVQRQPIEEEEEELQAKPLSDLITPLVQRQVEPEEEEEEELLQPKLETCAEYPIQRQPEEEEEEEMLQAKPLSDLITPLVQRQVEPEEEEEELLQPKLETYAEYPIQRQPEEEEEEEPIMTKGISGSAYKIRNDLSARLNLSRSGGQPLPETDRSFMERRFGVDFSSVRVHTDSNAAQISREINAQAFTHGRDIHFGAGRYSPGTLQGKRLLAHELTHIIQQQHRSGAKDVIQREALYVRSKRPSASSSTGHAYVTLEDEQNRRQSWGFYAVCAAGPLGARACTTGEILGMLVGVPGVVRSDRGTSFDDSIRYPITENRYRTVLCLVRYRRRHPPAYDLTSYNCVHFVRQIARCAGIDIPNLPGIDEPSDLSRYIRQELDMRLLRSGALRIEEEGDGGGNVDLRERASFRVSGLHSEHNIRFRWALQDTQRRCYAMMGPSGPVSRFGPQPSAFILPETRQLLMSRNVRRGTVICQAFSAYVLRGLHRPVTFTW